MYCNNSTRDDLRCPRCGAVGRKVPAETVPALVLPAYRQLARSESFFLCRSSHCPIVYFGENRQTQFSRHSVSVPVWFKETGDDVLICYCSGVTRGDIRRSVLQGARTPAEVKKATGAGDGGQCLTKNPAGA